MTSQIQGDVKGARKIKVMFSTIKLMKKFGKRTNKCLIIVLFFTETLQGNPSVVPAMNFDAKADAEALHKAMNDNPIDNDTLIDIICRRSNDQRQVNQLK